MIVRRILRLFQLLSVERPRLCTSVAPIEWPGLIPVGTC